MRRIVHLAGDDRDVMAVAEAALRSIGPTHARWVASVRRLHTERREYMRSLASGDWSEQCMAATGPNSTAHDPAAHDRAAHDPAAHDRAAHDLAAPNGAAPGPLAPHPSGRSGAARPPLLTAVWWALLSVAAAAATVGALPLLPLQVAQDPALLMAVTPPAMLLAGALLVLTAVTMPRSARSCTGLALAVSSAVFAGAAVALSAFRWDLMVAAGGESSVLAWLTGAIGTFVAGGVLAWRVAPQRATRTVEPKPAEQAQREFATELVSRARRYARKVPNDEAVRERWRIELAELAGDVPLESIEQARSIGPWRWLVWAAYDGEVHLPDLLATRR